MFLATTFELQPILVGETLTLRPLVPEDLEPLYAVARDPLVWEQHPQPDRYQRLVFEKFFQSALDSRGALVVMENGSGRVVGSSRYYEWNSTVPDIAIGYTFLARELWGSRANRRRTSSTGSTPPVRTSSLPRIHRRGARLFQAG